jgi:cation transport ATPase
MWIWPVFGVLMVVLLVFAIFKVPRSDCVAAGASYAWRVLLSPACGAVLMSASTVIVAINARLLRLKK